MQRAPKEAFVKISPCLTIVCDAEMHFVYHAVQGKCKANDYLKQNACCPVACCRNALQTVLVVHALLTQQNVLDRLHLTSA